MVEKVRDRLPLVLLSGLVWSVAVCIIFRVQLCIRVC